MERSLKRYMIIVCAAFLIVAICMVFTIHDSNVYAASKGVVTSVSNTASGIQVKWSKDTSKSGYYIYRKAGSAKNWTKVKSVKDSSKASWTDTNVKNGVKYTYKVRSYSGKKVTKNSVTKVIYRLSRPKITSLTAPKAKAFKVKVSSNSKATGYQIRYSSSSSFKSSKTTTVKGTSLNKTVTGLSMKTYYVKVRTYKKVDGKTYYSAWSASKSKWVYRNLYTINQLTTLHKGMETNADKDIQVWYRTALKDYGKAKGNSSGEWRKVIYEGSTYYLWNTPDDPKVTTTAPKTDYSTSYTYRNKVVKKAMYIYNNWKTKYDRTGKADAEDKDSSGRHAMDCSGFVSYVLNSAMDPYISEYKVTNDIEGLADTESILNKGFPQEVKAVTVTKKFDTSKLSPGDVIFFNTDSDKAADHVGIYLGNKEFIHSTASYMRGTKDLIDGKPTGGVCISPLKEGYEEDFMMAKRFVPDSVANTKINQKMVTTEKIYHLYSASNCSSSSEIDGAEIGSGETVTLIYTVQAKSGNGKIVTNGYVKYGTNKYAYVFKYADKMEKD